jgi:hypothetical protein
MKYRIKTKEEFKKEFGENWRVIVKHGFVEGMDPLLGVKFDGYFDRKLGGWSISRDMVINFDLNPNIKIL